MHFGNSLLLLGLTLSEVAQTVPIQDSPRRKYSSPWEFLCRNSNTGAIRRGNPFSRFRASTVTMADFRPYRETT